MKLCSMLPFVQKKKMCIYAFAYVWVVYLCKDNKKLVMFVQRKGTWLSMGNLVFTWHPLNFLVLIQ